MNLVEVLGSFHYLVHLIIIKLGYINCLDKKKQNNETLALVFNNAVYYVSTSTRTFQRSHSDGCRVKENRVQLRA